MADPIGSEFGMVSDEITYGADLEAAMQNLYCRVGSDDLPLFVTAVSIQASTGGNLGEILENLSGVIRQRFKMRRKIRALAAEGRASALISFRAPNWLVHCYPGYFARFLRGGLAREPNKDSSRERCRMDARRQSGDVQNGKLQDLTDGDEPAP